MAHRSEDVMRRTPARADALRNREKLLDVARTLYAQKGAEVTLNGLAKQAGFGVGTVYRHFPTREVLLEAVIADRFDALQALAEELLAGPDPGGPGLRRWLDVLLDNLTEYRGLPASTLAAMHDETSHLYQSCHGMRAAAARLLRAAQDDGTIREDLDVSTLLKLSNAVALVTEQTGRAAKELLPFLYEGITPRS
ncbi:TetR/AcrR family transcriptional regulator [Streptomyces sp. NPDC020983]|uniref:TetR/AcrR family transcriptional regulator n=1 Tax=Streptomyces sp. NPDC020983 TaxID=3365106 RepID=UPI0037A909BC